ncbi:MAG: hypothetical protein ACOYK9_00745 [Chlamydiia bacterium]
MSRVGALTYNPTTGTNQLELNPFCPHTRPEAIFESAELLLNAPDCIPGLSRQAGHTRICLGITLIVIGLARVVLDFYKITTHEARTDTPRPYNHSVISQMFQLDRSIPSTKRIVSFASLVSRATYFVPDPCAPPELLRLYDEKTRHMSWIVHGIMDVFRGFVASQFSSGSGCVALFLYDHLKKYRCEYISRNLAS